MNTIILWLFLYNFWPIVILNIIKRSNTSNTNLIYASNSCLFGIAVSGIIIAFTMKLQYILDIDLIKVIEGYATIVCCYLLLINNVLANHLLIVIRSITTPLIITHLNKTQEVSELLIAQGIVMLAYLFICVIPQIYTWCFGSCNLLSKIAYRFGLWVMMIRAVKQTNLSTIMGYELFTINQPSLQPTLSYLIGITKDTYYVGDILTIYLTLQTIHLTILYLKYKIH